MSDSQAERARRFANLADLIVDVAREVRLRSGIDAPGVPLNQTQSQVMRYVHANPGCLASEIARDAGIKRTNVSSAVQELRDLGYLVVARDARDGRALRITATALAESTVALLRSAWSEVLQEAWDAGAPASDDVPAAEAALEVLLRGLRSHRE
ncbi:MarR family winged helix-turn-helix transcriptional regulator [Microbacterium fluvii]|uniref:MarR family winged helix-turn-helix transcriptional regulator n=1 Tax=Microbacterium fluvii TaxID=415215 RepID=A0ABW2HGJ0_9MICO|nr:helix-turn-helix domain-containing protein [Microbacterium fluvii]MCU4673852.1 MarR family winged helix-turn-helix transcriptional regulator [Microbacterium fluvii]